MKKIIILLAFTFMLGSNMHAQSGIQFSHGTWKELLAKAEKENKLIFMDAYAEWCGPCKKMARDVFPIEEVGNFYNAKFINVKMDMEKGEGVDLSKQYGVMAYPTLLFLNKDGEIVHRAVGYHTSELMLDLGNAALDPSRNSGGLKNRYQKGDRSPDFLKAYALQLYEAMDGSYGKIAEEYLDTQKDWSSDKNMEFVFQMAHDLDSKLFHYIMTNKKAFEQKFSVEAVAMKTEELVHGKISNANSEADLKVVDAFYAKNYPERASELSSRIRLGYYAQKNDWTNFAKTATALYTKYPAKDWSELNEIAWLFYEGSDDKAELKQALKWAEQSIKMERNYYNMDTKAALLFKLGKKGKALKAANQAIELAKKSGEDYSGTTELIAQIKAK